MTTRNDDTWDVAIIGYGPTGATLANLLGQSGLRVLVLEREAAAYHLPRAVHFDAEVMRVFQAIGLAEEVEPTTMYHPGMRFVDAGGNLLLDWPRPLEAGPQGWKAGYRFHQPDLERILRDGVGRFPNVDVRTRCEVFAINDQGLHVELRYENMAQGKVERVRASYVVGCDGARSLVRRYIETGMEDCGFHERWLVIDLILKQPKPELGDFSIQYCNPARPATYVPVPGMRRRWEITVLPHEDSISIATPERVWELLADWITPDEAFLERTAVYTFHSLIADKWRSGRLLLAGDSCHQTPPFMGQGMCAGIRDAANLGWKLAFAVKDGDIEALLESYASERRPNVTEYIRTAVRLGGLINACGTQEALATAMRSEAGGPALMKSLTVGLGEGLGSGPHAGMLFPQPRLGNGALMDDVIGYAPVLIIDADQKATFDAPAGLTVLTTDDLADGKALLNTYDAVAILVRPDRYILATARDAVDLPNIIQAATTLFGPRGQATTMPKQEKISA